MFLDHVLLCIMSHMTLTRTAWLQVMGPFIRLTRGPYVFVKHRECVHIITSLCSNNDIQLNAKRIPKPTSPGCAQKRQCTLLGNLGPHLHISVVRRPIHRTALYKVAFILFSFLLFFFFISLVNIISGLIFDHQSNPDDVDF